MTQTMAPLPRSVLPLLAVALVFSLAGGAEAHEAEPTAYEMLEKHGFPQGILPEGATSYALHEDGTFEVQLGSRGDCDFTVQGGYLLRYKRKVTGRMDEASSMLKELKGISVKVFFAWFGISKVARSDGRLSFFVGPLSTSFPLSNFEDCPRCRCGFNCAAAAAESS